MDFLQRPRSQLRVRLSHRVVDQFGRLVAKATANALVDFHELRGVGIDQDDRKR